MHIFTDSLYNYYLCFVMYILSNCFYIHRILHQCLSTVCCIAFLFVFYDTQCFHLPFKNFPGNIMHLSLQLHFAYSVFFLFAYYPREWLYSHLLGTTLFLTYCYNISLHDHPYRSLMMYILLCIFILEIIAFKFCSISSD